MKRAYLAVAALVAMLGLFPMPASATTILSHLGATDPTTEGWTQSPSPIPAGTSVGPVINDAGLGVDAWSIVDHATNTGISYVAIPSPSQLAQASILGWTLRTRLRIVEATSSLHEDMLVLYRDGVKDWDMRFGLAGADPVVFLVLPGSVDDWPSYTVSGAGSTYHLYELRYDPGAGSADLFVDGVERISNFGAYVLGQTNVNWGAGSSRDTGAANYNLVEFEVGTAAVPEPGSLVLLGAGLAGLATTLRRRRAEGKCTGASVPSHL